MADIEIVVVADPPKGSGLDHPDHPTLAEKDLFQDLSEILGVASIVFTNGGGIIGLIGPILWPEALYAIILGAEMGLGSAGFAHLANDPPQPNYQEPVRVRRLAISPPSTVGVDIPGAQILLDTFNDLIPLTNGLLDAYERAQGATTAGDQRWSAAHRHGAKLLQWCVTTCLLQLASRLEQFRSESLDTLVLSESDYASLQERAQTHNLIPKRAEEVMINSGLTLEDLRTVEDSIAGYATETLPTGDFKNLVTDLAARLRTAATNLALA